MMKIIGLFFAFGIAIFGFGMNPARANTLEYDPAGNLVECTEYYPTAWDQNGNVTHYYRDYCEPVQQQSRPYYQQPPAYQNSGVRPLYYQQPPNYRNPRVRPLIVQPVDIAHPYAICPGCVPPGR